MGRLRSFVYGCFHESRVLFVGVLVIRALVCWSLYGEPLIFGNPFFWIRYLGPQGDVFSMASTELRNIRWVFVYLAWAGGGRSRTTRP